MALRIVFAEDNYLVREGTSALLRESEDIELVAVVEDLPTLLEAVEAHGPEAVLTDIRMPPSGTTEGIEAAKRIRADHPDVGVVVLSNQLAGVGDIARHLLRPSVPLERPTATKRTEIALNSAVLDTYGGRYEAQGEGIFIIVREGDFLTIQLPADWGLPKMRLHPESLRDFFAAELPLRVTFQTDGDGRVNGLLVHPPRGQKAIPANRISSDK